MSFFSDNLKVLLWKNKGELTNKTYSEYIDYVAKQCHMTTEHFRDILLDDAEPTGAEEKALRDYFSDYGYDLAAIRYDFIFGTLVREGKNDLITKNLLFLLSSFEWGENAEFINAIGVNQSTVSRWKQGITKPDKESQLRICRYFGYPDARILREGFLFLGLEPISSKQRKQACKRMIDEMNKEEFERIYPALRKLLN